MRKIAQIKKYVAVVVVSGLSASPAFAASAIDGYFTAIDLSSVSAAVVGVGVTAVGIAMAVKGIGIAKRVINKA